MLPEHTMTLETSAVQVPSLKCSVGSMRWQAYERLESLKRLVLIAIARLKKSSQDSRCCKHDFTMYLRCYNTFWCLQVVEL